MQKAHDEKNPKNSLTKIQIKQEQKEAEAVLRRHLFQGKNSTFSEGSQRESWHSARDRKMSLQCIEAEMDTSLTFFFFFIHCMGLLFKAEKPQSRCQIIS